VGTLRYKSLKCQVRYDLFDDGDGKTLWGRRLNHDDVFKSLADAVEMVTLHRLALNFARLRVNEPLESRQLKAGHMIEVVSVSRNLASRVILMWIMEHCVQINLQLTFVAYNFVESREWTWSKVQTLLSIALGIGMAFLNLVTSRDHFEFTDKVAQLGDKKKGQKSLRGAIHQDVTDQRVEEIHSALTLVRQQLWIAKIGRALLVAALIYALCKLSGIFYCKDAFWNLTGCVDLHM